MEAGKEPDGEPGYVLFSLTCCWTFNLHFFWYTVITMMETPLPNTPIKIAVTYAIAGALWILLSGWLLQLLVTDPALITRLTMFKGWAFIAVTTVILHQLNTRNQKEILRSNETIREQIRIYRELFHNNPQPMWVHAVETLEFLDVNDAAVEHYGYSRQEFLRMSARDICLSDDVPALTATVEKFHGKRAKAGVWQQRKKDSSLIDVEITTHDMLFNGRAARLVLINDITGRKRVELENRAYQDRLRHMGSQISLIEERERRQLATVLHDQIGQVLALARIKLGTLKEATSMEECRLSADTIQKLLEQAIDSSRSLTFEISPPILYDLGFEAAVQALCEKLQLQHGLQIRFRSDAESGPLPEEMGILLYRAVRELLVNVIKHAEAKTALVTCRRNSCQIVIVVADDGKGFQTSPTITPAPGDCGFGLFSIREQLHHLGGELTIDSIPDHGTSVTLTATFHETLKKGIPP